jgi:CTP synthase
MFIHLTLLPYIASAGEMKTKPTQHSVKELRSIGIQPDLLLCRAPSPIPAEERRKIALFCNVRPEAVIDALDVEHIYDVPLEYHARGFDTEVLRHFRMSDAPAPDLSSWQRVSQALRAPDGSVSIAIVGKYVALHDAYKSVVEALRHGGLANRVQVELKWIPSDRFDDPDSDLSELDEVDGVLLPGGFGERGAIGKMRAAGYARRHRLPCFGICYGMQLAVIELARNVAGIEGAGTTEFGNPQVPVVGLMNEWLRGNTREVREQGGDLGGTMRLGAYPAQLRKGSLVETIYASEQISERHRHRYEVNAGIIPELEKHGVIFSGMSPDGKLPEIVELQDHPWFIGVQFHPELKSRPFDPHPLFKSFIAAAVEQSRLV